MNPDVINAIKTAPKEPGCYLFYGGTTVLYIGKAAQLRQRLHSYLPAAGRLEGIKTELLDNEATRLTLVPLRSEIEALIEESRLIKELKPKYNIIWRDDKSYLYVAFTKEKYPRVFVTHQSLNQRLAALKPQLIGPFTDSGSLRLVMKLLRRIFPYCTCTELHLRECLNAQIGKCLGFCCMKASTPTPDEQKRYAKNIRAIKAVLQGQSKKILKTLTNEEERAALEKIFEHKPFLTTVRNTTKASDGLPYSKIECYDNSNLGGKESVGAMTALVKKDGVWQPDKNSYRKFRIKFAPGNDDPRMMTEVLQRRLNHPEWPFPDLIIIDGGITQYRAAKRVLVARQLLNNPIALISMAKPQKQVYGLKPDDVPTPIGELPMELQKLIEQAIYQTHNFVIRYHRDVRSREMFGI